MKKSNFVALVLGTISGVFFALGMCMALIPEWQMSKQGIISGVVGIILGIITLLIWRKMEKKEPIKIKKKTLLAIIVGIVGALLLGIGLCAILILDSILYGTIIGLIGIVILIMLIPLTKGLK